MEQIGEQLDNFAHFGDGHTALIINRRKFRKADGTEAWEFFFRPNKRLIALNPIIKDEINPSTGLIKREYSVLDVRAADENPNHLRIWIFTDFNGDSTPMSRSDDEKDLMILQLQKTNAIMQLNIAEQNEMLRLKSSPHLYLKDASESIKLVKDVLKKQTPFGGGNEEGDNNSDEFD